MVDALHGWESRNLDLMSSRRWAQRGRSLEWFRANQIRKARQRIVEGGGENIECLVLQRIWKYKEKIFDKKRDKDTDRMKRNILTHANPKWREQRSTCARILGPSESRYNEEEESWGGAYQVGQSDGEVEWLSKMVRSLQKLQKCGESS